MLEERERSGFARNLGAMAPAALIALLLSSLLPPPPVTAQPVEPHGGVAPASSALHRITLHNGSIHFGRMVDTGEGVRLELRTGEVLEIGHADVAKIETVRGTFETGEFWPTDPNETRLFFAPTGRSLRAGGGSFNAYYGLVPFLAYGVTDRLSVAGGTPLFFGDGDGRPLYGTAKVQVIRSDPLQLAVGALAFHFTGDDSESAYLAYGAATWQPDPRSGITAGAGWGYADGGWSSRPALMLGGDLRSGRRAKLITENYLFPGGDGILSAGVRVMGERISADLALATVLGESFVFPLVNFSYGW